MSRRALLSIASLLLACSTSLAADIRRVVTGLDADKKAIVLFDSRVNLELRKSGNQAANLWITDTCPLGFSFKKDAADQPYIAPPPDNGTVLRVIEFPPLTSSEEAKMDPNHMMKVFGDNPPTTGLSVKHPLMHRSRTVDYAVIMSGEIDMMLDDSVVHLKAGDVVIQQATNHAWINHSKEPVRILFVLMDSKQP